MAISPKLPAPSSASTYERVEAWTVSQAASALAATSLSSTTTTSPTPAAEPRPVRGTAVTIEIPLDESVHDAPIQSHKTPARETVHTVYKRRTPIRRDSLVRREALLKGKEGSRRRQRWENDRLLGNPWAAEPPLPSDWAVAPTHPVQRVPYAVAPLWEAGYARMAREREEKVAACRKGGAGQSEEERSAERVAREVKAKLKHARAAKGLLQDLEEEVRGFVREWEGKQRELEREGLIEPDSSEDEEIVFVGRNGAMSDERRKERENGKLEKDKLIFQSLVDDHGAAFGRYLVHAIGAYYGLKTWSVTTGNPARREAYVGLALDPKTRRPSLTRSELPRPLWTAV